MTLTPHFRAWEPGDRAACLALFDANCPRYFAANERGDYEAFLDALPVGYEVCLVDGRIAGAYGVLRTDRGPCLRWILLVPEMQGRGLGRAIMNRAISSAETRQSGALRIAASHESAPFFARFGAREISRTPDGWGPGMHRVDMLLKLG
ncbi:MAG TPA: GNAT family N-acetyltransferase [Lacunisphaera sp.]|nr:GNAT family N-acetyltransferase [Lacunisphaera sp.]